MHPAAFVIAALFLPVVRPVAAQEPPPVQVGERVRVWTSLSQVGTFGTLASWHADSLAVSSSGEETWILLSSVTRLEVRRQKISRGALVALDAGGTAVGGALFGALLGFAVCSGESNSGSYCTRPWGGAAIGAVLVGGTGLVFGAVYGLFASTDRWEEVPLDRLRVSFLPQSEGRFALGWSVRF